MIAPTVPDTSEVVVHRCTVTVVRHGGWSWGPEPRSLVHRVVNTLPDLLAQHFGEHLTGEGPDVEIAGPVVVTVRPGRWPASGPMAADVLISPEDAPLPGAVPYASFEGTPFEGAFEGPSGADGPQPVMPAAALFGELAERGELGPLLALLPDDSVRAYLLALLGDGDPRTARSPVAGRVFAELALRTDPVRLARALPGLPHDLSRTTPGETIASLSGLLIELVTRLGREGVARLVRSPPFPSPVRTSGPGTPPQTPAAVAGTRRATAAGEVQVWSALPFLLAGPLARVGYLDAIGPALGGLGLIGDAPLFAAALAYKVLGVTGRGRRRAERDVVAAAAFAGLAPPPPEEELTGAARRLRPALPVLDGVLALSVSRGHDPADPLLVTGAAGGLLLVDAQGLFPIAWTGDVSGLLPHWRACGSPVVLVCGGPLAAGCLKDLAAAGVPFLTAVRPLRGDPVTRLPWRTPLWAAEGARVEPRLAAELPGHAERLGRLVLALVTERRAVPLAADEDLERTATSAALLGLATIAWTLWRDRETPDPFLALTRFADLAATVRYERAAVRVRVPLGRRHADLLRSGLLADVPDVVWLGGRTLTFSGG
ncbi:hypothetical protein GCM10017673_12510 [Streptosporangium violaceochromogenes]|nr:hypothetical protein GCM10017673_12510 [Streptosporangium violaceochromogenes]